MSSLSLSSGLSGLFPASPVNHVIRFSRLPNLTYVVQEVALPGVSATPARNVVPGLTVRYAPDRLTYEPLNVTFMVDEEFRTHRELHRWLTGVTGGEDRTKLVAKFLDEESDYIWEDNREQTRFAAASATTAGLTIVNATKTPILRILFYNVHLTNIGPVQFSVTTTDTLTPMTSTATFEYDFYSIVELI